MNLSRFNRAAVRHLTMRNYDAYEQVLKAIKARGDIWMVSQGEYMAWWQRRNEATLRITVTDGICQAESSLEGEGAVFEKFPSSGTAECENAQFSGEVWLTIDSTLEKREVLIEILKREGILNYRVAQDGDFFLSREEMTPLLSRIDTKLHKQDWPLKIDINAIRQLIIDKLAEHGLPLVRIWYHPVIDGTIIKAVLSPRYDVDRAITNLSRIRALEQKYGVTSTLYLRAFSPFYSDRNIKALASSAWCTEIGLHGEFARNSRQYGDEFSAAGAEKQHLERLVGRPVVGVCMHGGEMTSNVNKHTTDVLEKTGFLYDTTPGMSYYLPFRPIKNGEVRDIYLLNHVFGDIKVPSSRHYTRDFYEKVMEKMNKVYEHNGVFVLTLHPVYFNFFAYLFHPRNFARLVRFFWDSFNQ